MKTSIAIITGILLVGAIVPLANADKVPDWVKNNAGWWADDIISDEEFISGIQHLIQENILTVSPVIASTNQIDTGVPDWVKNNAGWWADDIISDEEFISGIQHLIKTGIVNVPSDEKSDTGKNITSEMESELIILQNNLDDCSDIVKAYDRLNCEKIAEHKIDVYKIKNNSEKYQVGPVTYYWPGLETDGNTFEITSSGQALLNLRILVENTESDQNESLFCTGPAVCNYDITNGDKTYKYAQMDFTNGQLVLKPGESKVFNMMFGPNIGGGGTTFEYDSGKQYHFRVNEPFGSTSIPLNLG